MTPPLKNKYLFLYFIIFMNTTDLPWVVNLNRQQLGNALGPQAGGQVIIQHIAMAACLLRHAPLHKKWILLNRPRRQGRSTHQNGALN